MAQKPPAPTRVLVSAEVPAEIDAARIPLIVRTEKEWTKTAVHDALIRVGLNHLDEVAEELLRRGAPSDE